MAIRGVSNQLSTMIENYALMRTGIVVSVGAEFCTVDVGSTNINAAYLRGVVPTDGDQVAVVRQGATWFVLGTTTGSGMNEVVNPSFEAVGTDGLPTGWTFYNVVGTTFWESVTADNATDGGNLLEGGTPTTSTGLAYSSPIGVTPGQVWQLGAYAGGVYPADGQVATVDVTLQALWFANATNLYPTTVVADTNVVTVTNIADGEDRLFPLFGTVTVPATVVFMRVGLRAVLGPNQAGVQFDSVSAKLLEDV